jgi:glycosyltransferase involved in cell wall biosynthesis
MMEAIACGTPVIAWDCGSVPEIVEHGVTGFIVRSEQEAVDAVGRVGTLKRRPIRDEFERRFTAMTMAKKYLEIYARVIDRSATTLSEAVVGLS